VAKHCGAHALSDGSEWKYGGSIDLVAGALGISATRIAEWNKRLAEYAGS